MTIAKFKFSDRFYNWTLNEMTFNDVNLLVGISGVGKTQILNALQRVRHAGITNATRVNGCEWMLELSSEDFRYIWTAKTSRTPRDRLIEIKVRENSDDEEAKDTREVPHFLHEHIVRGDSEEIVSRTENAFVFLGKALPKLKNTESAVTLLRDEDSIAPLYRALRRFIFSEAVIAFTFLGFPGIPFDQTYIKRSRQKCDTLEALRESTGIHPLVKAFILQEDYPYEFLLLKQHYTDIFETVSDVRLGKLSELAPKMFEDSPPIDLLTIAIQEEGIDGWITADRLSSGMYRILIHLIELTLASPGTVIMIDEFENSLGVNCLPALSEYLLNRTRELQCILTSHHPYVINKIPPEWWKIVTRNGPVVTVKDGPSIPALQTASAHEKFIQLMNLREYEAGIR